MENDTYDEVPQSSENNKNNENNKRPNYKIIEVPSVINFPDIASGKKNDDKTKCEDKVTTEEDEKTPASDKSTADDKSFSKNYENDSANSNNETLNGEKTPDSSTENLSEGRNPEIRISDEVDHSRKMMKSEDLILPPSNRFVMSS